MCVSVCARAQACVRACVRACVCVRACSRSSESAKTATERDCWPNGGHPPPLPSNPSSARTCAKHVCTKAPSLCGSTCARRKRDAHKETPPQRAQPAPQISESDSGPGEDSIDSDGCLSLHPSDPSVQLTLHPFIHSSLSPSLCLIPFVCPSVRT